MDAHPEFRECTSIGRCKNLLREAARYSQQEAHVPQTPGRVASPRKRSSSPSDAPPPPSPLCGLSGRRRHPALAPKPHRRQPEVAAELWPRRRSGGTMGVKVRPQPGQTVNRSLCAEQPGLCMQPRWSSPGTSPGTEPSRHSPKHSRARPSLDGPPPSCRRVQITA